MGVISRVLWVSDGGFWLLWVTFVSHWGGFGHLRVALASLEGLKAGFGMTLGSLWGCCEVSLRHFGVTLGDFGVTLGSLLGHFWVTSGI